jgi:hypothetical protein
VKKVLQPREVEFVADLPSREGWRQDREEQIAAAFSCW